MSNLYLMVTITDRKREKRFRGLFEEHGADVGFVSFGHGTAVSEILDSFGLEASEKSVMTALSRRIPGRRSAGTCGAACRSMCRAPASPF